MLGVADSNTNGSANVLAGMPSSKSDAHYFGEKPLIDRRHRQLVAIQPAIGAINISPRRSRRDNDSDDGTDGGRLRSESRSGVACDDDLGWGPRCADRGEATPVLQMR